MFIDYSFELNAESNKQISAPILAQIEKIEDECEEIRNEINSSQRLALDMLGYLSDERTADLKAHFAQENFVPILCIENSCLRLPPGQTSTCCPLKLDSEFIRTRNDGTVVVLKLNNFSNKFVKDLSCSVYFDTNTFCALSRSCLLAFHEKTAGSSTMSFSVGNRKIIVNEYQPFYISVVRPGQDVFLSVHLETPNQKTKVSLLVKCLVSKEADDETLTYAFCAPDFSTNNWSRWYGTLKGDIWIEPWSDTDDDSRGPESLKFKLASRIAFLPCWTIEIEGNQNIVGTQNNLNFKPLTENVHFSDHPLLNQLTIIRHEYICAFDICSKSYMDFEANELECSPTATYSVFGAEDVADRFFRRLLDLKLCTNIQNIDVALELLGDNEDNVEDWLRKKLLNDVNFIVSSNGIISGGQYRKIKADLIATELLNV